MIVPPVLPPEPPPHDQPTDVPSTLFCFYTTKWREPPEYASSDPNDPELVYRRRANDDLYKRMATSSKWNRFITLGYYAIDDGANFDKEWNKMESEPMNIHRIIWYNFLYHVDRDMEIDPKLNAWATQVSEAFLTENDPASLGMNTMKYAFKEAVENKEEMEVDSEENEAQWIPVTNQRGRTRNRSAESSKTTRESNHDDGVDIPGLYIPGGPSKTTLNTDNSTEGLPVTTAQTEPMAETTVPNRHSITPNKENITPTNNSTIFPMPHHAPPSTNDGTHRLTIRWTPKTDSQMDELEDDTTLLPHTILELIKPLFKDSDGCFYRWESTNLLRSSTVSTLQSDTFREFISPHITFMSTRRQIVFGLRFRFATNPVKWRDTETRKKLEEAQINVNVSNSICTSGKLVIAGYIFLKAPNSTHRHRYTQYLLSILPPQTPHFDVVKLARSPLEDEIPHLAIQCGEHHVTPLCETMAKYLTGRNTALFMPSYALQTMTDTQVKDLFSFHQMWNKSLSSIQMSPMISHLDQLRVETFPDGRTMERSTREWASSLLLQDGNTPALCDVVNGTHDRRALMLAPSHFLEEARRHWEEYRKRILPNRFRTARFRNSTSDLPEVINITTEIRANVEFLQTMSAAEIWSRAPAAVRGQPTTNDQNNQNVQNLPHAPPGWYSNRGAPMNRTATVTENQPRNNEDSKSQTSDQRTNDHNPSDDQSTDSTQALTRASQNEYHTRFAAQEEKLKRQKQALDSLSKTSLDRLNLIERQLHRFDTVDASLATMASKIDQFTDHQQEVNETLQAFKIQSTATKRQALEFQESNDKKIDTLGNTVVTAMEAILDIRSQFEKISQQVHNISNLLDPTQRNPSHQVVTASVEESQNNSNQVLTRENTTAQQQFDNSSQGSSTQGSSSEASAISTFSIHSPVKKKRYRPQEAKRSVSRSQQSGTSTNNMEGNTTLASTEDQSTNDVTLATNTTNLFNQLQSSAQDLFQDDDLVDDVEMFLTPPNSPDHSLPAESQETPTTTNTNPAPLDPRYNINTGPAGASPS